MKRTPLRRKTPLRRTPMRRGKGSTKYARRPRDTERMRWTKLQRCSLVVDEYLAGDLWFGPIPDRCAGPIEAHHAGSHGTGQKAPDDTVIPMCKHHHRCVTGKPGGRGCFDGWPRGTVKRWELAVVTRHQRRYDERDAVERFLREAPPIW